MPVPNITPLRVVIAGGGVGALEALMALHDLGEQQLALTLVAPDDDFVLRPMSVAVPFSEGHVTRVSLDAICERFGARRVKSAIYSVDAQARTVSCDNGDVLEYDRLILAIGAGNRDAYVTALTFHDGNPTELNGLLRDIEQGYVGSVALVVPPAGSWSLPIYELALMLAKYLRAVGFPGTPIHLITPESAPLAIFGPQASAAMADLLVKHGITLHTSSYASIERGGVIDLAPGDRRLEVQRIVALPIITGRAIDGIPSDDHGFAPVDDHARVLGIDGVYAVGDGANFPVKQGGLATQQADAAARDICADAGAAVDREPFRPVLRGMLLTGADPRFLRHAAAGGDGESRFSADRLWWPPTKVVGHYLGPWLAQESRLDVERPSEGITVDADLPIDPDARPLATVSARRDPPARPLVARCVVGDHDLVVVTGKGGVGKTTVAAAWALAEADRGRRVLVAEVAAREDVALLLGQGGGIPQTRTLAVGLDHLSIDPGRSLEAYLRQQLPRVAAEFLARSRVFQPLTAAAPGLSELLSIGQVWDLTTAGRGHTYDVVVLDAPAGGHGLALLGAPGTYARIARGGPVRRQAAAIDAMLRDPARTAIVAVATPETLAVNETAAIRTTLEKELSMSLHAIVVNGLLPPPLRAADAATLRDAPADPAISSALWLDLAARTQRVELDRLRRTCGGIPMSILPRRFRDDLDDAALRGFARRLRTTL